MPAGQTSPVKSLKPVSSAKCLLITQFWGFNSDALGNFDEMKMKPDELFIGLVLGFPAKQVPCGRTLFTEQVPNAIMLFKEQDVVNHFKANNSFCSKHRC